jgi:hypothetical protein
VPNGENDKPLPVSSSIAPEFHEDQVRLFREVLKLMNDNDVPYAVSGAFALQEHTGIFRDTKDLDLFLPAEHAPAALQCLRDAGFEIQVPDPVWLAKAHAGEYFVDLITGMSNAAITVDESWIERATPTIVLGVPSRVLGAEELLASKLFVTRRERFDGADTVHIIYGKRGRLDWNRILALAGENWEIVLWTLVLYRYVYPKHADYVPEAIWKELLDRFRRTLTHPDPHARFRGSLIDENMFAIDVHEWGLDDLVDEYRQRRQNKMTEQAPDPDVENAKPAA